MIKNTLSILTATLGLALAAPAMAQSQAAPKAQAQAGANEAMKGRRAVIGEVVEVRDIQFKGIPVKHRLVKIRNRQGNTLVVDLGDATKTEMARLKKGSRIFALGKEARVNGDPVLYARYFGELYEAGSMGRTAAR